MMDSFDINSIIQNEIDINKSKDLETHNDKIEKRDKTVIKDVEMNDHMKG